jgi:outer membrane receptor protein involved in Fe transport
MVRPQRIGANDNGTFTFRHNLPFNPADPFTYPSQFSILMGDILVESDDDWFNGFVQDQWRVTPTLTLNLGLRYDYQQLTPETKAGFAPRLGFAYDPNGSGRTVIRGGIGKFYDYSLVGVANTLNRFGVYSQTFTFQTNEDTSADNGRFPTSHVCLLPSGSAGLAAISPACRAFLTNIRNSLQPGAGTQFINTEPQLDGDRRMGYLLGYSVGVKHELRPQLAVGFDYVGNRGYDQTAQIDISEGPVGPNGRIIRLTPDQFDPTGELIPVEARGASYQRVRQYQTLDAFNSDFDSFEFSLEKRFSNRWSGRAAYTLAWANDVTPQNAALNARVSIDPSPRDDYGRASFDNRHAFVTSVSFAPFGGFTTGAIVRYYSGYPINETIGTDVNGDRDNIDRPVRGVHDLTRPILSEVDANGRAVRNGIDGNSLTLVDLQLQYVFRIQERQSLGLFAEIYNLFNKENLGNPTGNRNNRNFMVPVEAGSMRSAQLGIRYTF